MAEKLSFPNPEEQQSQEPIEKKPQEEKGQDSLSPEKILKLSPKEMAGLFADLDDKRQLQSFLEKSAENPSLVAQFSYWEKWLEKDHRKLVDDVVAKKREAYGERSDALPLEIDKRFTEDELEHFILPNIGAIQLTFGCSKGCPLCGFDAVPGLREHIPYSQLANLFQKYGTSLAENEPILYWASEPSDYASKEGLEDKTYQDVHQLAVEYAGYCPFISSRETNDVQWLEFLGAKGPEGARASVYGYGPEKVEKIKEEVGDRISLIGEKAEHKKGMGTSFGQEEPPGYIRRFPVGIACKNGLLLTPRGLYGIAVFPISEEFPQGQVVVPFEKITDEQIKPGDILKDVLRRAIIVRPNNDINNQNLDDNPVGTIRSSDIESGMGIFSDTFRKEVDIQTQNKLYRVWCNEKGVIQKIKELDPEKEKADKEERKKNKLKYYAEVQKAREETEKEYLAEKERLLPQVKKFINQAVENSSIASKDTHFSEQDVALVAKGFSGSNLEPINSYFDDKKKIIAWTFRGGIRNYKEAGNITLRVKYHRDNKNVDLDIETERSEKEERVARDKKGEELWRDAVAKANQLVSDAVKNNRVEVFTHWTDDQLKRVIKTILELDFSKSVHDPWKQRVDISGIGEVAFELQLDQETQQPILYIA